MPDDQAEHSQPSALNVDEASAMPVISLNYAAPPPACAAIWRRGVAYLIDWLFCLALLFGIMVPLLMILERIGDDYRYRPGPAVSLILFSGVAIISSWLYVALMNSSRRQATFGKSMMEIKVACAGESDRVSFGRASVRYFAEWLSFLALGLGFLPAFFSPRGQTLHDLIAGTVVTPDRADARRAFKR